MKIYGRAYREVNGFMRKTGTKYRKPGGDDSRQEKISVTEEKSFLCNFPE